MDRSELIHDLDEYRYIFELDDNSNIEVRPSRSKLGNEFIDYKICIVFFFLNLDRYLDQR